MNQPSFQEHLSSLEQNLKKLIDQHEQAKRDYVVLKAENRNLKDRLKERNQKIESMRNSSTNEEVIIGTLDLSVLPGLRQEVDLRIAEIDKVITNLEIV